jgi:AraC-like DNA-binding protein
MSSADLPLLDRSSDAMFRFVTHCQMAACEYAKPTDSVRVCTAAWGIIRSWPGARDLAVDPRVASVLVDIARRTLDPLQWAPTPFALDPRPTPAQRAAEVLDTLIRSYRCRCLSLATLSRQLEISPAHLCRVLSCASGYGLSGHLGRIRLLAAICLLSDTNESIATISQECGYGHVSVLDHQFRRFINMTPTQFRRLLHAPPKNPTQEPTNAGEM